MGHAVQRRCIRLRHVALCYSEHHLRRLLAEGYHDAALRIGGIYTGPSIAATLESPEPLVLFVGRHIPEKRAPAVVEALAIVRRERPEVRATIVGDGPDRPNVAAAITRHGLREAVTLPGFVSDAELNRLLRRAACLVLPSWREGFGLVLLDAIARGTPVVTVAAPENAASELVVAGVNGTIAASASAEDLGSAILSVMSAGMPLRESTARWWVEQAPRLSAAAGYAQILTAYGATTVETAG
ncbi:MAG: glycosyltransferase family 4 protein [Thermomicrobiales bacterium]|nr:glycosyltransferase family 4 protein [Thermomicrobiales bacterium]